ncbi:helix-turn-helix domain-containing protein [Actinotalea sp. M2MS4P-6]|uniref:helix-turn-helix domain-containing protein n=1 Tax=Actinotalea sp. M2MS4P-6 TaxID=2983762 RepID=UPI0021E46129|nr:helix-turn-helix domain-containing protein [Actinotalea sp. M2MS4P-6]MCV2392954.1 helix-turn-helix domain-containing protein [Actinotalea sp. M2MS4P-6]
MAGRVVSPTPWQRLPTDLVPALHDRMSELGDAVAGEITVSIGVDDPKVALDVRRGVDAALERFADLVGTDAPALPAGVRETFVDLGAAEAREDRPPETLVSALRASARVMFRVISRALAKVRDPGTEDLVDLSDAVTAYVDELVAATTEGFTLQLREQAGEQDRRRRLLAEMLVRGSAPERAVQAAAEGIGWRRIDAVVPILLPLEQTRQAQFRYRDDAVVLERERDSVLLLRRSRPAARGQLERAMRGRGAVIGVTVDWARVPQAVRLAELTAQLASDRADADDPVFAEDHLATLALRGVQSAFALLSERRLAPFAALRESTRERHLETLHSWLRHWGSRAAVADELRIHPQTVSYRVRQLHELLGDDLDDPDVRFELAVVLADRSRR